MLHQDIDVHRDIEDSHESKTYSEGFGRALKGNEKHCYSRTRQRCASLRPYIQSGCDFMAAFK